MKTATHTSPISTLTTAKAARETARRDKAILMYKAVKFVLACYVLLMFKPAVPLLSDMIAHTFYEQQHILLVHEVQGKFHIHQQLGKASHQSDSEKSNEQKVVTEQYVNVLPSVFKALLPVQSHGSYLSYAYHYPFSPYRSVHSPPPKPLAQNKISEAKLAHGSSFGLSQKDADISMV